MKRGLYLLAPLFIIYLFSDRAEAVKPPISDQTNVEKVKNSDKDGAEPSDSRTEPKLQVSVNDRCSNPENKIKHFIMNKIEKTGSSTLYGILARFVWNNKLNVLTQRRLFHIDWTKQNQGSGMLSLST